MPSLYNETMDLCSSCGKEIKGFVNYKFKSPVCKTCNTLCRQLRNEGFSANDIYQVLFKEGIGKVELV